MGDQKSEPYVQKKSKIAVVCEVDAIFVNSKEIFLYRCLQSQICATSSTINIILSYLTHANQHSTALCLPHSSDSLGDTNVVGLELVQSNTNEDSRNVEEPVEDLSEAGVGP